MTSVVELATYLFFSRFQCSWSKGSKWPREIFYISGKLIETDSTIVTNIYIITFLIWSRFLYCAFFKLSENADEYELWPDSIRRLNSIEYLRHDSASRPRWPILSFFAVCMTPSSNAGYWAIVNMCVFLNLTDKPFFL
jgi:hypothetical protein